MIWALRYVALVVAFVLFGSATGDANLAMAPTSASQTIASINLSSTTFVPGGTATVGTISATMSPSSPSFTGAFTLGTGSGCAGTDNATFSISGGTTLQTTNGAGSYSIGLVATQAGISNSPFCHEFSITGASAPSVIHETDSGYISGGCKTGCAITIPSTTLHNALYVSFVDFDQPTDSLSSPSITGVSGCVIVANSGNYNNLAGFQFTTYVSWWACENISAGVTSITLNQGSTGGSAVTVLEATNVPTSGTTEVGAGTYMSGNSPICSTSGSTTHTNDLLLFLGQSNGGSGSFSAPSSPWVTPVFSGGANYTWSQIGATTTTYSGTLTDTGSPSTTACAIIAVIHL